MDKDKMLKLEIEKTKEIKNIDLMRILQEMTTIHNNNFHNKVNENYFKEIFLSKQYDLYCLFNIKDKSDEKNYEIKKITEKMEKNENISFGYIVFYDTIYSLDLFEIAIDGQYQGKGFGNKLFEKALELILSDEKYRNRDKEDMKIFLEVNRKNLKAIKLYKKNNFEEISVRKNYYGLNEDALIMVKSLKK